MQKIITPAVIGAVALASFILRIFHLGTPRGFIFDEVYYVDGARDLLRYGVEVTGDQPEFIVHPPIGKWAIALGIRLFGDNEFGWRIMGAVLGTAMIILIALIAQKLFRSPIITIAASSLMAIDGLALVHSRTALLDIYLAFFILTATYFFVIKNYWVTGIFLGLAMATKWSGLYFLLVFGCVALYRAFNQNTGRDLVKPAIKTFLQFGILPIAIYFASWIGWFNSSRGWGRNYSTNVIESFFHYHSQMLGFHTGLVEKHPYQANPWSWLVMGRPTSFFYETPKGCGADNCSQEVLALGTPLLWWLATITFAVVIGFWIRSFILKRFEPSLNIILLGMVAGYLPWFFFQQRTVFSFYAIVFEPFLILTILYCLHLALADPRKRRLVYIVSGLVFIALLANFIYFLPLYTGEIISYGAWSNRMWLPSWI